MVGHLSAHNVAARAVRHLSFVWVLPALWTWWSTRRAATATAAVDCLDFERCVLGLIVKPALMAYYQNPNYLTWIHAQAAEINADGCTGVTGFKLECCEQHDVEGYYGKDAHDAYRLHKSGSAWPWSEAKPITFEQWNAKFRRCLQARSKLGRYSPMAWWRWIGVRVGARRAWNEHRQRERQPT